MSRLALTGTCLARHRMLKGRSAHPPCTMLRAARRSKSIFSPPGVEGQTSRLLPKHLKKEHHPAHPAVSHSPRGAARGSACAAMATLGAASRHQTKNTAGRSFSSATLSHSLSHSSTARFKTPEGSALDFSLPTAASGNWLSQSPSYLPGAGTEAARSP